MGENPFKATVLYKLYGVDMIALKSSSVRAAGYNEDFKTLYVEFISGATYKYKRVPKEIYIDFMNSRSPGKFVNDVLTVLFNYEPVSGVPRDKRGKSPYERSEEESEAVNVFARKVIKELMDYQASPVRKPAPRSNYIKSGWTRHDAFSQILHDNPPRTEYRDGDIVVLNVKFSPSGHTYCYRTNDDVYKPGDVVEVRVSGVPKAVTVDSVGYYSKEEYPFDVVQLNYVEGMAAGELADRYKEAVEAEKSDEAEREKIRTAAMKELKTARKEKAEATRMHDEATEARKEAEEKKKTAEQAIKETKEAGEKARQAEAKLEAAKKEAAKTWKRKRPKTDNETIKSLRKVQDALDEDEQIYKALSALEVKMSKVIEKSEEMIDDETNTDTTNSTIRRLYSYYLPKTISVLEQYKNIFSSGLPPKNIEELRQDLLDAIDKSEEVYDNVLTDLYEKDIMELEIEMEVLKTMFALSGLMDSDFDVK